MTNPQYFENMQLELGELAAAWVVVQKIDGLRAIKRLVDRALPVTADCHEVAM